jgi:hypothetical protein
MATKRLHKFPKIQDSRSASKGDIGPQLHCLKSTEDSREIEIRDQEMYSGQRNTESEFNDLIGLISNRLYMAKSKILGHDTEATEHTAFLLNTDAIPDAVSEPTRFLGLESRASPPKRFYRTFWRSMARKALVQFASRSTDL